MVENHKFKSSVIFDNWIEQFLDNTKLLALS